MWQISYPLWMVRVRVIISCQKFQKWLLLIQKQANRNCGGTQTCKLFLKWSWFFYSRGMKLKNLKIRFWRPAHVKRIIADLVQKWGDNNAHFCQLARNGPIQNFWGLNGLAFNLMREHFYDKKDRLLQIQTNRQILWHHMRVWVDFFFKINLLRP